MQHSPSAVSLNRSASALFCEEVDSFLTNAQNIDPFTCSRDPQSPQDSDQLGEDLPASPSALQEEKQNPIAIGKSRTLSSQLPDGLRREYGVGSPNLKGETAHKVFQSFSMTACLSFVV